MRKLRLITLFSATAFIGLTSCEKEDDNSVGQSSSGITMALKTTDTDETEYIVSLSSLSDSTLQITATNTGIEQIGWRFYYPVGNTLFTSGYGDDSEIAGYADNGNGVITKKGGFVFDNALEMFGHSDDNQTLLAMEIPRSGFNNRKLYFVDVNTGFAAKVVSTKIYEDQGNNIISWPTALQVRDDKLFVPFQMLNSSGSFATENPDSAFVAVYSYPNVSSDPDTIIKDARTSNIGVNGATTGMIETESGDLYSFSCGAEMAGFAPVATKPSGILKIKSGEIGFDQSYFFNIETATSGGKLFWFDYVGGNKAIGRILTDDNGGAWAAYGRSTAAFNQKLVIIDLVAQTVTDVANVPLHAKRYSSPIFVEDGKALVSIETETDAYVYVIDIDNATGTKGAEIVGKTIKGFYRL